jgi:hypothetical protein
MRTIQKLKELRVIDVSDRDMQLTWCIFCLYSKNKGYGCGCCRDDE